VTRSGADTAGLVVGSPEPSHAGLRVYRCWFHSSESSVLQVALLLRLNFPRYGADLLVAAVLHGRSHAAEPTSTGLGDTIFFLTRCLSSKVLLFYEKKEII
jgi:hypothetical protein